MAAPPRLSTAVPEPASPVHDSALAAVLLTMQNAAGRRGRPPARLLAVSKARGPGEVATLAAAGQGAFGENYVQEALPKIAALHELALEWHLIGHLQSNKAAAAALAFDWVQSLDRASLVAALARHRPGGMSPLNVLVQVNIDDEPGKHGCQPGDALALADAIAAQPRLRLRGLMAIPAPHPDFGRRREAFRAMRRLFEALHARHPGADTLSMGMSEDYATAIEEGATMVRVGSALFGPRTASTEQPA